VTSSEQHPVEIKQALWRGFTMRCPNCGKGQLFEKFLKVSDHCSTCGEVFSHHCADDFPAYLVIVIVGHLIVPGLLIVDMNYQLPLWLECLIWLPLTLVLAVALLQPVKGAIVGLQWQTGMHGFAAAKEMRMRAGLFPDRLAAAGQAEAGPFLGDVGDDLVAHADRAAPVAVRLRR
jgi:uncharacterized protein (DUF983 family)